MLSIVKINSELEGGSWIVSCDPPCTGGARSITVATWGFWGFCQLLRKMMNTRDRREQSALIRDPWKNLLCYLFPSLLLIDPFLSELFYCAHISYVYISILWYPPLFLPCIVLPLLGPPPSAEFCLSLVSNGRTPARHLHTNNLLASCRCFCSNAQQIIRTLICPAGAGVTRQQRSTTCSGVNKGCWCQSAYARIQRYNLSRLGGTLTCKSTVISAFEHGSYPILNLMRFYSSSFFLNQSRLINYFPHTHLYEASLK